MDDASLREALAARGLEGVLKAAERIGATAVAALRAGGYVPAPDERVAIIVCGGNVDPSDLGPRPDIA